MESQLSSLFSRAKTYSPYSKFFFFSYCFKLIFIGIQLLYNVVCFSTVQKSESAIHIFPLFWISFPSHLGLPWELSSEESACHAEDAGSIPGSGRSPGEGNGNPFQYSCLENPMDREAWQVTIHGVTRVRHNLATKPPPLI